MLRAKDVVSIKINRLAWYASRVDSAIHVKNHMRVPKHRIVWSQAEMVSRYDSGRSFMERSL